MTSPTPFSTPVWAATIGASILVMPWAVWERVLVAEGVPIPSAEVLGPAGRSAVTWLAAVAYSAAFAWIGWAWIAICTQARTWLPSVRGLWSTVPRIHLTRTVVAVIVIGVDSLPTSVWRLLFSTLDIFSR